MTFQKIIVDVRNNQYVQKEIRSFIFEGNMRRMCLPSSLVITKQMIWKKKFDNESEVLFIAWTPSYLTNQDFRPADEL